MDQPTIQAIAAEIARHLPSHLWVLLLIQAVITVVAAAVGAFLSEYFKTRGRNLATKTDFENLKAQLRANTELVETIKTEIGHKVWARREWSNLRRVKMEELLRNMHECQNYLERYRSQAVRGEINRDRDPIAEFEALAVLYFPELKSQAIAVVLACRDEIELLLRLTSDTVAAGENLVARQKAFDAFQSKFDAHRLPTVSTVLTLAARELLLKIMDVEPG
jgi:hypothetical protein